MPPLLALILLGFGLLDGSRVGQNQVPHSCELFYLYIDAHITGTYIYIYICICIYIYSLVIAFVGKHGTSFF